MRTLVVGVLLVAALAMTRGTQAQQGSAVILFEGARLIVGDATAPIADAAFTVADGRILQVGRRGQLNVPAGATRIDLTGKTVMPAIVDAHTHMPVIRAALIEALQRKAYYGVSAVMSLGQDTGDVSFQVRGETIPGAARLRTAGRGITMPEPGRTEAPYWVTTEAEARKAVADQAARNLDLIKIWVDDRDGMFKKLTPALYGAIIDEAHKHNVRVTAHIFTLEDAKGLLRAGIDAFAHGIRDRDIDDEIVTLFRQRPNVFVVPNLPDRGVKDDLSWLAGSVPADELARLQAASTDRPAVQQTFGIQARNLARLSRSGVTIAMGTDGNVPYAHHIEMADMVAAGMTPADVIVAATSTAAQVLRLTDLGTVAPGKSADFLILDANPLDNITNTRRISAVYLRGTAVDRAGARAR